MALPDAEVVHLVTADTSAARADALATLLARPYVAVRQRVVHLGTGAARISDGVRSIRVHTPFGLSWLGARAMRRELEECRPVGGQCVILHAWSATAARWCIPLVSDDRRLLVDVDADPELSRVALWPTSGRLQDIPTYVCPTLRVREGLLSLGVPAERCVLIRPGVDAGVLNPDRRADIRAQLQLDEHDVVVTALPPLARHTGTFTVAWAVLLVEKVRPDVRLVVPAGGREQQRVRRLVESCQHERVARYADQRLALPDLLAASDVAAYLPNGPASTDSLAWAMAAGCPLVASAVSTTTELLTHGENAWLCRPNDPEEAARALLQVIEHPAESRERAERARAQAASEFGRERMVEQYRRCYEALTTGDESLISRPLAHGRGSEHDAMSFRQDIALAPEPVSSHTMDIHCKDPRP